MQEDDRNANSSGGVLPDEHLEDVEELELFDEDNFDMQQVASVPPSFPVGLQLEDESLGKDSCQEIKIDSCKKETITDASSLKRRRPKRKILIIMGLVFFLCILILLIFFLKSSSGFQEVSYTEESFIDYRVCLVDNTIYPVHCLSEGEEYVYSLVDAIPISFRYTANYSEEVNVDFSYYVVGRIYTDQSSYDVEELLTREFSVKEKEQNINFSVSAEIDYPKYRELASRYSSNSSAVLEVSLIFQKGDSLEEMATLSIPLSGSNFQITKDLIYHEK